MDKTKIAVDIFDKRAQAYADRFMDVSLYHESLDAFCSAIKTENASVLELACGPGNITKYLLQKRPDFKIRATDLSPNMLALAKSNNPLATVERMDCRNISQLKQQYHGIMCGFCLPYLSKADTLKLLADASKILYCEGVLYISTMEDAYKNSGLRKSSDGKDEMYLYFHEAGYLQAALEANGFEINTLQRLTYSTGDGMKTTDLILIAKRLS